jgi:hypothetical protein
MAKTKPKAHQLYKQATPLVLVVGVTSNVLTNVIQEGSWQYFEQIPNGETFQAYVNRMYIDLEGWNEQDLTTFTTGVDIQKDRLPIAALGGTMTCPLIYEFDIISTRMIADSELTDTVAATTPGYLPSTMDLMEVVYGEQTTYAQNSNIPGTFIPVGSSTWGSGNPTASDKLHWTRIYVTSFSSVEDASAAFNAYPTNLVIQATTMQEKDLVYMERLRRSYVLQGEL